MMKSRLDRLPWPAPSGPAVVRQPSPTAGARRARRHRQRRKVGARCLTVEMSKPDLQSLAKVAQQADPIVERTIRALLRAAYGTHRERPSTEAPNGDVCALCGAPGVLMPCSAKGKYFVAHLRCFNANY